MTNITEETREHTLSHYSREEFRKMIYSYGVSGTEGVEVLRLIRMCANTFEAMTGDKMRGENMSESRWRLLLRLRMEEKRGNCEVNPSQLATMHNVSKNTISSLLRSLDEQGLIIQVLDNEDRRKFKVGLSDAGRKQVDASMPRHMEYLQHLTSDLTDEEREQLLTLLSKLHNSLIRHRGYEPTKEPT